MAKQAKAPKTATTPTVEAPEKGLVRKGTAEIGVSGTHKYGGIINEDYKSEFNGPEAMRIFDEMRKSDGTVAAAMKVCKMPIRRASFFVKPVDEKDQQEKDIADFVRACLWDYHEGTFDDFLRQALLMLDFGVMAFEKVFDVRDVSGKGRIVWRKIAPRMPRSILEWQIGKGTQEQRETGITQQRLDGSTGSNPEIPMDKLVVFVNEKEGDNWWGISALRPAYKPWYMKKNLELIDAMAHERQGLGVPIVRIPDGMHEKDKRNASRVLKNLRADHEGHAIVPKSLELEFLETHANTTKDATTSIEYHNRQIMLTVLAQFLMLGGQQKGSGSRATSEDHSELFLKSIEAIAGQFCDVVNRYMIRELVEINFGKREKYPELQFADISKDDIAKISEAYQKLVTAGGLRPTLGDERYLRGTIGLPERTDEDDARDQEMETKKKEEQQANTDSEIAKAVAIAAAKGATDPQLVPAKKEADVTGKKPVPVKAAEELDMDEHYFRDLSRLVDNAMVSTIQNSIREEPDRKSLLTELKKKGLRFNAFEDQAGRPLTFAERKIDLEGLQTAMAKFEAQLEEKLTEITDRQKADLVRQVKKAVEDNDITALDTIGTKYKAELSGAIAEVQKEMFEVGKKGAAKEMGVEPPATSREVAGAMKVNVNAMVDRISNDLENDAKQAASEQIGKHAGSITATGTAEAVAAASTAMDKRVESAKRAISAIATTGSVNMGRGSVFARYPEKVYAYQYSAILDFRTTDRCRSLDGRVVKPGSAEYYAYSPPQHHNCRSMWAEILTDELYKPDITGIPSSITPGSATAGGEPLSAPQLLSGSPAATLVRRELDERKAKVEQYEKDGTYPNRVEQHKKRIAQLEKALRAAGEDFVETVIAALRHG